MEKGLDWILGSGIRLFVLGRLGFPLYQVSSSGHESEFNENQLFEGLSAWFIGVCGPHQGFDPSFRRFCFSNIFFLVWLHPPASKAPSAACFRYMHKERYVVPLSHDEVGT